MRIFWNGTKYAKINEIILMKIGMNINLNIFKANQIENKKNVPEENIVDLFSRFPSSFFLQTLF